MNTWDPEEVRIALSEKESLVYEQLQKISRAGHNLHQWYLGALQTLLKSGPDCVAQAAHSLREITDKLPDCAGVPRFETPVPKVKELGSEFKSVKRLYYPDSWNGKVIVGALDGLLQKLDEVYSVFDAPPRTARLRLALTARDPNEAQLSEMLRKMRDSQFKRLGEFFQNVAHHNHLPAIEKFREQLNQFETLVLSYLGPVTASQQKKILALIAEDPSEGSKQELVGMLIHNAANLAFLLERLDRASWLTFLEEVGLFEAPPQPEIIDGAIKYPSWPVLWTLARLAAKAPNDSIRLLERVPKTDNPAVNSQILRCLVKSSRSELADRQTDVAVGVLSRPTYDSWIWVEELAGIWMDQKLHGQALQLIAAAFNNLSSSQDYGSGGLGYRIAQIDKLALSGLGRAKPLQSAQTIMSAIERLTGAEPVRGDREDNTVESQSDSDALEAELDSFSYWFEGFVGPVSDIHEIEDTLLKRLYLIGRGVFETVDTSQIKRFDALIRSSRLKILKRLRWQLYADFPEHSADLARKDVLDSLPKLDRIDAWPDYEYSLMVEKHAELHGNLFLTETEIHNYVSKVKSGPLSNGRKIDQDRAPTFRRFLLHPIRTLLRGDDFVTYQMLSADKKPLTLTDFKPFGAGLGGGVVKSVAPMKADKMALMSNDELWDFLNTWKPGPRLAENFLIEETYAALGNKFADLVESQPNRFLPETEWWTTIRHPVILLQIIERAIKRITPVSESQDDVPPGLPRLASNPSEQEWRNWFGVVRRFAAVVPDEPVGPRGFDDDGSKQWHWPRMQAVRFLNLSHRVLDLVPEGLRSEIGTCLMKFLEDADPDLLKHEVPSINDWLNTGINSVRGTAYEALLGYARNLKNRHPEKLTPKEVFMAVEKALQAATQSPALFAISGASVGLWMYLFGDLNEDPSSLLLPHDRYDARAAFVLAHYNYSSPAPWLIKILPKLAASALECLEHVESPVNSEAQGLREFASRLGLHLAFYYWNGAYSSIEEGQATVERYFRIARHEHRAEALRQIGRLFQKAPVLEEHKPLFGRTIEVWDMRLAQIMSRLEAGSPVSDYSGELFSFSEWLGCECFPFEWRFKQMMTVLGLLEKTPRSHSMMESLDALSASIDKISKVLQIVHEVVKRAEFPDFRWTYPDKHLKAVLRRGVSSTDGETRRIAEDVQEMLLRHSCFEYLNLDDDE